MLYERIAAAAPESAASSSVYLLVLLAYAVLVIAALFHGSSYYRLIQSTGSVTTAILQSLRAVSVFYLSDVFFCGQHPEQCLNKYKARQLHCIRILILADSLYLHCHSG